MTGDHHDRTARRATLLVTAADEILGTHTSTPDSSTVMATSGTPGSQSVVSDDGAA
jgi:hypothetical protein